MLTQPPVEAPADQRASQMEERLVDIGSPIVAYLHVPVAIQPRQHALHYPPMPPQLLAAIFALPGHSALDAGPTQGLSALLCLVGLK